MDYSTLFTLPNSELLGKDFSLLLNEQKQYYIDLLHPFFLVYIGY
jgi:hypothetical protein